MFRVRFETTIQARNGAFGVSRTLDLPFVPQAGLYIDGVRFEEDGFQIGYVSYDVESGEFYAVAGPGDSISAWEPPFTAEDARDFFEFGCEVDGETTLADWLARHRTAGSAPDLFAPTLIDSETA